MAQGETLKLFVKYLFPEKFRGDWKSRRPCFIVCHPCGLCAVLPCFRAVVPFRPFLARFPPVSRPFLRLACVVYSVAFDLRAFISRLRRFFACLDKIYGFRFFVRFRA
jgi:hypothetical protein